MLTPLEGVMLRPSNDEWLEAQFDPDTTRQRYGITLPSLPSDEVQIKFTAQAGRGNLTEAFEFYKIALDHIKDVKEPRILDFGCGWGRVARFFLRETKPENLYLADVLSEALQHLRATGIPFHTIQNGQEPPINGVNAASMDLAIAFSVFSHLSERRVRAWLDYLFSVLKPGGAVVFTTRGHHFIDYLRNLYATADTDSMKDQIRRLSERIPDAETIADRHAEGSFQWYGTGWDNYPDWGETFIPRAWLEREYGSRLVYFSDQVPHVYQAVAVLQKPQ